MLNDTFINILKIKKMKLNQTIYIYLPEKVMKTYRRWAKQERISLAQKLRNTLEDWSDIKISADTSSAPPCYTLRASEGLISQLSLHQPSTSVHLAARNILLWYYHEFKQNLLGQAISTNQNQIPKL